MRWQIFLFVLEDELMGRERLSVYDKHVSFPAAFQLPSLDRGLARKVINMRIRGDIRRQGL